MGNRTGQAIGAVMRWLVTGLLVAMVACGPAPAAPQAAPTQAIPPTTAAVSTSGDQSFAAATRVAAAPAAVSTKETMTIALSANQGTLDPHFAATTQEMLITRNIYSSLLKYKPDSIELVGDLATDWAVSADGLTYTFNLRKDVEWHKGFGHFTASDVKASFDRLRSPETKSPFAGSVSMLKDVQLLDDYTVKMVLTEPYAAFPHLLTNYRAGPIVNAKAVAQFGKDFDWNPIGTGPYAFEAGIPKQEVTVVANDAYFRGAPPIKRIVTRTVSDFNAQVLGLENGQYDMLFNAGAADETIVKRVRDRGFAVSTFSRNLPDQLMMNVTVKPFDDLRVRQAVAHAIDRQQYVDLVRTGYGKPWYSPIPEGYFAATSEVPRYEHDAAKSKSLLNEAGYPGGFDVTMTNFDQMQVGGTVLAEQLKQVGIRVTQEILDQPTWIPRVVGDKGVNFAIHCCVRQPDPDIYLSDAFSSKARGALYISHYDIEPDLAVARRELDVKKREQLYVEIQKKLMTDLPVVPLAMLRDQTFFKPNLHGMPTTVEPLWGLDLSQLTYS